MNHLALGDSISIDTYTNVPGGGAVSQFVRLPLENLTRIADRLAEFGCPVILSTIYDPTDGDDALIASYGVGQGARAAYNALNDGIREIARRHGFLLADLEELFHDHGAVAADPWIVSQIEPNHAGATAIAKHWHQLCRNGWSNQVD